MTDNTSANTSMGFSESTMSIMCYVPVLGILPSLVFVFMEKNKEVKWHAVQSALLWLTVVIAGTILQISSLFEALVSLVNILGLVVLPLLLAIKVSQKEKVRLPILADLADKFLVSMK
jgi:uncharacterized membrane protein